ncbi:MAG: hypothetical protein ABJ205_01185 [Erythrobacter sp.]|uniref:hypothetical protein n=1 Tax=Erythrobacter sp. TaxID=1042 RepID=UPI003262EB87
MKKKTTGEVKVWIADSITLTASIPDWCGYTNACHDLVLQKYRLGYAAYGRGGLQGLG